MPGVTGDIESRRWEMKLLLAYDGFEHSRFALEETARIAHDEDAEVTVLSIVPPDARGSKSGGHVSLPPHAEEDVARAEAYLAERGVEAQVAAGHGRPADEIVEYAEAGGFDLVLLGTRGLGPVGRVVRGSVGRKVAKHAPCAVRIVGKEGSETFEPMTA